MSLAGRTSVVGLRISGVRSRHYLDRGVSDFLAIDALLDQLIAIAQRLARHRERFGTAGSEEAIQLLVVSRDAEFVFGLDVVVLQVVIVDGPVSPHAVSL